LSHAKSFVTVVGGLILLGSAALASSAQPASDAQINEQLAGALRQVEPNLARRVQVDTKNGVVTLSGQTSPDLAAKALQAAQRVPGVTKVRNPISVMQ